MKEPVDEQMVIDAVDAVVLEEDVPEAALKSPDTVLPDDDRAKVLQNHTNGVILKESLVNRWNHAFLSGELYFTPGLKMDLSCKGIMASKSMLDGADGIYAHFEIPTYCIPTPVLAIEGKPFSVRMTMAEDDSGSKTLKMEAVYLEDHQIQRLHDMMARFIRQEGESSLLREIGRRVWARARLTAAALAGKIGEDTNTPSGQEAN